MKKIFIYYFFEMYYLQHKKEFNWYIIFQLENDIFSESLL